MTRVRDLMFLSGHDSGPLVLGVTWLAPSRRNYGGGVHPDMVGFHIDVHPVAATERSATRAVLRAQVLPQLREWVTRAITADETWQLTDHAYYWRTSDGRCTGSPER
ncbi:hypothetical protein GT025_26405 [Streptomyces sp. SID4920]|nr:hypothetical protein [Streptomyces sp. SID4920]MYX65848.1 hypothetical protein [Streptomyces sp. SID8373]